MPFLASTEHFEGPLDLMLHLIRENKLDIFDLDVSILCDEYLAYLDRMEELKLEVESEYLVELATLIEYKSKRLLPKKDEGIDDKYEEDPRENLVRRLLEYQRFKEVSERLYEAYEDRLYQMAKPMSEEKGFEDAEDGHYDGNIQDLYKAMNRVLRRVQLQRPIATRYTQKEISIDDRLLAIRAKLKDLPDVFTFEELIDDCKAAEEAIVTFLAVLELIKDSVLDFKVGNRDEIYLKRSAG